MKKNLLLVVLLALGGISAKAQTLIDIQFGGSSYNSNVSDLQTGAGVVGSAGDIWNNIAFSSTQYNTYNTGVLNNTAGTSSGVSLAILPNNITIDEYSGGPGSSTLPTTTLANLYEGFLNVDSNPFGSNALGATFTFSGLTVGANYNLYLYSSPNASRASKWSLNGATPVQVGTNGTATALTSPNNYILLSGAANGSGNLVLTASSAGYEIDVNGFQLQAAAVSVPEPSSYALMLGGLLVLVALRRKSGFRV